MSMKSYWLTKYALTGGIRAVLGDEPSELGYVRPEGYWNHYRLGKNIHETEAEAKKAAESMRLKKIASLRKQIAKLEELKF